MAYVHTPVHITNSQKGRNLEDPRLCYCSFFFSVFFETTAIFGRITHGCCSLQFHYIFLRTKKNKCSSWSTIQFVPFPFDYCYRCDFIFIVWLGCRYYILIRFALLWYVAFLKCTEFFLYLFSILQSQIGLYLVKLRNWLYLENTHTNMLDFFFIASTRLSFIFYGTSEISRYLFHMPRTIERENKQRLYNDHVQHRAV